MERIVIARNLERALHDLLCARRTEIANHRLVESCEIQWQMRERGNLRIRGASIGQTQLDVRQSGKSGNLIINFIMHHMNGMRSQLQAETQLWLLMSQLLQALVEDGRA